MCAKFDQIEIFFRILQIYLQHLLSYILKFLICIHAGNPRVPPRVLASGPKPCRGNELQECELSL